MCPKITFFVLLLFVVPFYISKNVAGVKIARRGGPGMDRWNRVCTPSYVSSYSMCCDGSVRRKFGIDPQCCGTKVYDATRSMCCLGIVKKKSGIGPEC